ncbi:hypothetical protein TcWFU_000353 [Taenia crassiceps]|uniref:Uncharacterized protein n=1 Tax=Taenia crassiceps TaxID=6207 RepID=A0ABR4Q3P2_9CEST
MSLETAGDILFRKCPVPEDRAGTAFTASCHLPSPLPTMPPTCLLPSKMALCKCASRPLTRRCARQHSNISTPLPSLRHALEVGVMQQHMSVVRCLQDASNSTLIGRLPHSMSGQRRAHRCMGRTEANIHSFHGYTPANASTTHCATPSHSACTAAAVSTLMTAATIQSSVW